LPKKNEEKRRWTDPVILVPIIVAVITAIVSPIVVPMIQDQQKQPPPTPEPTPTPGPGNDTPEAAKITVETDKESYVTGDDIIISGNVGKPEIGKSVRIDIYKPDGGPLDAANGLLTKPERNGSYSYLIYAFTYAGEDLFPGTYTVQVTYLNQSNKTNFIVK
jgi:hypothetical protein